MTALLFVASLMLLSSCAPTKEVSRKPPQKPLEEHEREFDPSDYRRPDTVATAVVREVKPIIPEPEEVWVERKERVMGFRVQLHSTTSIDEAQQALSTYRSRLDSLEIDAGRIDMVFDAPYYKIRAGDFMVKGEADMLTDTLRAEGIPEAWVVRDNIFRMIRERQQD